MRRTVKEHSPDISEECGRYDQGPPRRFVGWCTHEKQTMIFLALDLNKPTVSRCTVHLRTRGAYEPNLKQNARVNLLPLRTINFLYRRFVVGTVEDGCNALYCRY